MAVSGGKSRNADHNPSCKVQILALVIAMPYGVRNYGTCKQDGGTHRGNERQQAENRSQHPISEAVTDMERR